MLALLASLGGRLLPVRRFLGTIPAKAWLALAIALALICGALWHHHAAHKAIEAAYQQGKVDESAAIAKRANELTAKINALAQLIAVEEKGKNDEENRRIARAADDLRVQGPGHAACPRLPAAASGHEPASGEPDASRSQVPPADSAAVPWEWLVTRAEEHDTLRAEVLSWRSWYDKMVKAWPKSEGR